MQPFSSLSAGLGLSLASRKYRNWIFFQYFYKQYQVSIIDGSLLEQNHKSLQIKIQDGP